MRKELSLYIHIPFCVSKCTYCGFCSKVAGDDTKLSYVSALLNEIKIRGKEIGGKYILKTIYIGGGTPSTLPSGCIKDILCEINKFFVVKNDAEITIEINPNSLSISKVHEYLEAGVNRFSVGLQSASAKTLKMLGRTHTKEEFIGAIKTLKSAGVTNISSDIIIGLPEERIEDVLQSIKLINSLGVQHISMYMLELVEGTKLEKVVSGGLLPLPTEEQTINSYHQASKMLKALGYNRYELSNFAKEGFESKHNSCYWDRGEYLGVGLSSHSFIGETRYAVTSDLPKYLRFIKEGTIPLEFKDFITTQEAKEETIMLSLRKSTGLDLEEYKNKFNEDLLETKNSELKSLIKDGFVVTTADGHLKLTEKGFMVINRIIELLAL